MDVTKPVPRDVRVGHASASTDTTSTTNRASVSRSMDNRPASNTRPRTSRPLPVMASRTVVAAETEAAAGPPIRRTNVNTNSKKPTRNSASYGLTCWPDTAATWSEPTASDEIAPVIVWPGPSRSKVLSEPPVPPATMATTIVSPIAREIPRITAAAIPDEAAGNTTEVVTLRRRAPIPYAASRKASGTANIASSATDATSGTVRIPTPMPAASRLNVVALEKSFFTRSGLITNNAKNAITMLGTPASVSMMGFRIRRRRRSEYSAR